MSPLLLICYLPVVISMDVVNCSFSISSWTVVFFLPAPLRSLPHTCYLYLMEEIVEGYQLWLIGGDHWLIFTIVKSDSTYSCRTSQKLQPWRVDALLHSKRAARVVKIEQLLLTSAVTIDIRLLMLAALITKFSVAKVVVLTEAIVCIQYCLSQRQCWYFCCLLWWCGLKAKSSLLLLSYYFSISGFDYRIVLIVSSFYHKFLYKLRWFFFIFAGTFSRVDLSAVIATFSSLHYRLVIKVMHSHLIIFGSHYSLCCFVYGFIVPITMPLFNFGFFNRKSFFICD